MAEETGGSGGAGGGSAGGTQVEGLQVNMQAVGGEQLVNTLNSAAKAAENFAGTAVNSVKSLEQLTKVAADYERRIASVKTATTTLSAAQKAAYEADKAGLDHTYAAIDAATRYLAKLDEMTQTYNNTTAELQRFKAAELGVTTQAAEYIDAMQSMRDATEKYGIAVKTVSGIDEARIKWEKDAAAQLKGQRAQALADTAQMEKEAAAQLNGQRVQAGEDQRRVEKEAAASLKGQKTQALEDQAKLEKESAAQLNGQRIQALEDQARFEKEAAATLRGQKVQALEDQLKLEKEASAQLNGQRIQAAEDQLRVEKESAASLKGQRIQALEDQARLEKESAAQLKGQKIQATEDQAKLEKEAAAELKGQRIQAKEDQAKLERESAAQLKGQRIQAQEDQKRLEKEAAAQLKGQKIQALEDNAKAASAAAEKEAIDQIKWGATSLRTRISQLEQLKEYQAKGISQGTIDNTFSKAAQNDVKNLDALIKQYNDSLSGHGKQLKSATEAANNWGKALGNNRVRSEALVLAHEALQNRFTRIPGSLMVMGEYLTSAGVGMGAFMGTALLAAAAVGGLGYMMIRGVSQQKEMNDALNRTNQVSGASISSLTGIADAAGSIHGNMKAAYESTSLLAASGKFTADQIGTITGAATELEHAFGQEVNVTIREFETLVVKGSQSGANALFGVSKALELLNEKYHFVTAAQMQVIVGLEKEGKQREATSEAIKLLAEEDKRAADQAIEYTGTIQQAWHGVTGAIGKAVQIMADFGKKQTLAQQLAANKASIAFVDSGNSGLSAEEDQKGKNQLLRDQQFILAALEVETRKAAAAQAERTKQDQGAHAVSARAIEDVRLMRKEQTELARALAINEEQKQKIVDANPDYLKDAKNVEYEAERVEAIKRSHSVKAKKEGDDGRKYDLQAELAHADSLYNLQEQANESAIKLLKDQYKHGSIAQDEFYRQTTERRNAELADLEKNEQAKLAILDKYKPKNASDSARVRKMRQQAEDEYAESVAKVKADQAAADQTNSEAQIDKYIDGINKRAAAEVKAINQDIDKQQEKNDAVGKTKAELDAYKDAQELASMAELQSQADAIDALLNKHEVMRMQVDDIQAAETAQVDLDARSKQIYEAELSRIRNLITARATYSAVLKDGAFLEEQAAAQKIVDRQWEQTAKKISNDLTDSIVDGGGKGWKKLIHDMEVGFAKMILQPIIQPIASSISSYFNPTATQAGGVAGVNGSTEGGSGSGAIGYAAAAANAYKSISGGFASVGSTATSAGSYMGSGIESMGNTFGSSTMSSFGQGMQGFGADGSIGGASGAGASTTSGMGSAAQVGAGIYAGIKVGSSISGEYGRRGVVNAGTAIGTGVGYYVGGSVGAAIGAAIGGAVGGLANRLFGMGDKKTTATGIRGVVADNGASGQSYSDWEQKGGFFRSDKKGEDATALTQDVVNSFTTGLAAMKTTVGGFAKTLGVGTDAMKGYSKDFNILLDPLKDVKGSAAEQAQIQADNQKIAKDNADKIAEFFTTIGDDLTKRLIPDIQKYALAGETASATMERLNTVFTATNKIADALGKTVDEAFGGAGLSSDGARESLVNKSGGLDTLSSYVTNYTDKFLTDAEKLAPAQKAVSAAMESLGLSSVTTKAQFEDRVKALDLTNSKDQDTFVSLMQVADAFATVTDAADKLKEAQDTERKTLQDEYDELTMTSVQLLEKQRNALNESNRALFDQINAIKALKAAAETLVGNADASFSVLSNMVSKQTNELQSAKDKTDKDFDSKIDAKQLILDSAKDLASSVGSALDSLKLPGDEEQTQRFKAANEQLAGIVSGLGKNGLPSADSIKGLLSDVQGGPNTKDYGSKFDYLRDFYSTRNNLSALGGNASNEQTVEQKMLDSLNDQKKAYDEGVDEEIAQLNLIVSNAQDQLDQLKGQSTSLLNIDGAMQDFLLKVAQAMQNPVAAAAPAINDAYQTYLGRTPDKAGAEYYTQSVANGNSIDSVVNSIKNSDEAKIRNMYQDLLGRPADGPGLAYWSDLANKGESMDQIRANIMQSTEYKDTQGKKKLPSLAVGTNYLIKDTVAQLHEGEAVLPKADNRALRSAVTNNAAAGAEVVAAVRAVQAEMAAFRQENKAGMIAVQRDTSVTATKIKRIEQTGLILRDTSDV